MIGRSRVLLEKHAAHWPTAMRNGQRLRHSLAVWFAATAEDFIG
jgi:hypothetical protein